MKTFLGIDFGTTTTVLTRIQEGSKYEPEVIEIDGEKTVDTALRLDADGEASLFGREALDMLHEAPEDTFYNFKRDLGTGKTFQSANKYYTPEGLALRFLRRLCQKAATNYFSVADLSKLEDLYCTVGCPAAWNEKQRAKLTELAEKAGFPKVTCCDEPFGVIYYYHFRGDIAITKTQNILVYDFGGGTTDIAIEEISPSQEGDIGEPKVLAAAGLPDLGGKYFDERLRDHFREQILGDAPASGKDLKILEQYSKNLKEELSRAINNRRKTAEKLVPLFSKNAAGKLILSENEFGRVCDPLIKRLEEPAREALEKAGLEAGQINHVILAGGSSRLYYVKDRIKALFPQSDVLTSADPVQVIAKGLALYGRSLHMVVKDRRGESPRPDGAAPNGENPSASQNGEKPSVSQNAENLSVSQNAENPETHNPPPKMGRLSEAAEKLREATATFSEFSKEQFGKTRKKAEDIVKKLSRGK
jgi:molecular chaperone DnaK